MGQTAPKLRGGAAVVRALVPFAVVLAESTFENPDQRERTMITAAQHLNNCYKHLSSDEFHGPVLKENAIKSDIFEFVGDLKKSQVDLRIVVNQMYEMLKKMQNS